MKFPRFIPALVFLVTVGIGWLVQSRVSITDCDAAAYVQGARSLRAGHGYIDALGNHLNHWPPVYSFLLSLWPNPLAASLAINLVSLGLASVLAWALARRAGWSEAHSVSLAAILGFGFFADLTHHLKPDILAYAGFLAGVWCYGRGTLGGRVAGCFVFALLIPVKLIAVTFAPGLLLAELACLGPRTFFPARWREILAAGCSWLLVLGGLLLYNAHTLKEVTPTTYAPASLHSVVTEGGRFCIDFFRTGLASWYGSIRPLPFIVSFALVAGVGLACLLSLRWERGGRLTFKMGLAILALSFGLEFYKIFFAGPRLMGYGMLLMLIGLRPVRNSAPLWAGYAAALLMLSVYNHASNCNLGLNHPDYEAAALEASSHLPADQTIYTNAHAVLGVHTGRPSIVCADLRGLPAGSWYWEVNLPNYDAITTVITAPPAKDESWRQLVKLTNGSIYQKSR